LLSSPDVKHQIPSEFPKEGIRLKPDSQRLFVLTGGPGSGKTTLIEALKKLGYGATIEAGRAIIRDQTAIGGRALPWRDPLLFAELMLSWDIRSYRMAQASKEPVFCDRGVPDVLGYLQLAGIPAPEYVETAAREFRYNTRVFLTPPWKEIFCQDHERKQDFDEAIKTYESMSIYKKVGYHLLEIPRASVEERVRFVLNAAGLSRPTS
jgi:predicted ATPase